MTTIKASDENATIGAFIPPGVVHPFAGSTAPSGWLLCNGSEYSQATYAALYTAIGSTYNTQVNPTTGSAWASPSGGNFRVPDYRGSFLRGVGTPYAGDAVSLGGWQAHKTAKNSLGLSGGSIGGDTGHTHGLDNSFLVNQSNSVGLTGSGIAAAVNSCGNLGMNNTGGSSGHSHSFTSPALGDGDTETRPHNKGVNYIIKY